MAEYILFGVLIGIFLFSTIIVCWQLVMTILEVRGILKIVRGLTEEVQPTIHEVNEILRKSNLALDEAGDTYQAMGQNLKKAKGGFAELKQRFSHWLIVARTGVNQGIQVFQEGEAHQENVPLLEPADPSAAETVKLNT